MRRGLDDIRELQRYVDAQAGGPGQGLLPDRHRPVRGAAGDQRRAGWPSCSRSRSPSRSAAAAGTRRRATGRRSTASSTRCTGCGVRSSLLLNKFDNPLTGVRFDSGADRRGHQRRQRRSSAGLVLERARRARARCTTTRSTTARPQGSRRRRAARGCSACRRHAPVYPPAPHCNTRGLTDLGRHVVRRMMDRRMIVNPDHMSQAAVDDDADAARGARRTPA